MPSSVAGIELLADAGGALDRVEGGSVRGVGLHRKTVLLEMRHPFPAALAGLGFPNFDGGRCRFSKRRHGEEEGDGGNHMAEDRIHSTALRANKVINQYGRGLL